MKNLVTIFCALILFSGLAVPVSAQVYEHIENFHVEATLGEDRLLTIREEITYDFGSLERHGIFRVIPERYDRDGAKYRYRYDIVETLLDGEPVQKQVTRQGDSIRIRLGDPDKTITGVHTYSITYTTDRAINDFPEDGVRELYWNVTGNDWQIPIQKASFTLNGPGSASDLVCYTGPYSSVAQECDIMAEGSVVSVSTKDNSIADIPHLPPLQGLTVAVRYPEHLIQPVPTGQKIMNFIVDNAWVFIPIIVFFFMYALWFYKGRDPKGRGTVIAQYDEPRGLTPIEMAGLLNQHIPNRAVAATILDFGRRGYLKIKFEGDPTDKPSWGKKVKFTLEKVRDADDKMTAFESAFFRALFPWGSETLDVSKVNSGVASAIGTLKTKTFKSLQEKKLFGKNPATVRSIWIVIGFFIMFGSFYAIAIFGILSALAMFLSAAIIMTFGWLMPRMTRQGAIVREEIEGLKLFLSVTEKDRLKFHNAPETKPEQFERFLPAAVAFGVEEQWAKHFEKLQIEPPSYFSGNTSGWTAMNVAHAADNFYSQASNAAFRAPSSSGSGGSGFSGGGSGGGGGGGGGGSW